MFCALAAALVPAQGIASVFGFKAGMTEEQIIEIIGRKALSKVDGDLYTFSTAPTPHPEFEEYLCAISPQKGLLKVVALSVDIETNTFGETLKDSYAGIQTGVSKTYGKGESFDTLEDGSLWTNPEDWMMGLLKKDRKLVTYWQPTTPQDHITIVSLEAIALSTEKGYLRPAYEFEGWEAYMDKKKDKQDNAF